MWWSAGSVCSAGTAAAEQLHLQRSSSGFSLTVTQDGPQFRTQRLGQSSRRYNLSLRISPCFLCSLQPRSCLPSSYFSISPSACSVSISFLLPSSTHSLFSFYSDTDIRNFLISFSDSYSHYQWLYIFSEGSCALILIQDGQILKSDKQER